VTVSDLGGGKLDAKAAYPDGGAIFVNEYHASGSAELTAVKELTGNRTAQIQADEFTFSVTEDETEVATGATLDGGTVKFTEITYTQEDIGTHTYVISENAGSNESISYTAQPVTVTIEVTDAGAGKLNTEIRYPDGGAKFVNEYHANGSLELKAEKELTGSPLQAGQFTFELKDADGKVLQTKQNDGDGLVAFDALAYTEADIDQVYTYTVSEVDGKVHGITYSTEVYTVKVTVKDNSDGTLAPETEITLDGETVTEMSFENVFGGTVSLLKIGPDGEHLKNAKFELYQKTEDGWSLYTEDYEDGIYTTGEEGLLEVKDLSENEYYFIEAVAPEGYITAKEPDGSVSKYTFEIGLNNPDAVVDAQFEIPNDKTSVEILKQDENGKAVAGAVLRVVDADGNKMDEWTTDGKAHAITGVLTGGETYRLVEVSAPKGYKIAQDITFTVTSDGPTDPVTMVDHTVVLSETGSAQLTKRLTVNGEPMAAEDSTFYAALFEDAECTKRVTEIKSLEFKKSSSATVTFEDLEPGTYYAAETDANGTVLSTGMIETGDFYLAVFADGQELTVTKDETAELSFENQFTSLPDFGFYLEGVLTVTKQLLSSDGEAMESDETFYAGVFDDPTFETLSASVYQNIVPISLGGASEASVNIPVVMPASGEITLYVTEVDENGTPVAESDDFAYEVTLSETEVTLTKALYAGEVTIVNREVPEDETEPETKVTKEGPEPEPETEPETEPQTTAETEPDTTAETESETMAETNPETQPQTKSTGTSGSSGTDTTAKTVKTGDETPTELYVILFAAAAIVLLAVEEKRRRGRKA
jgi:pilin isopeptide linkage protein